MEFFLNLFESGMNAAGYIIPFIIVLSVIVVVHEYGHYIVGKWCGVKIEAFSLGFGPELFGKNDKAGTRWKVCAIPLGGYVRFFGDENEASVSGDVSKLSDEDRKVAFPTQALWKRAAIVFAGPLANFLFAIFVFFLLFSILGRPIGAPVITEVLENSAAADADLMAGDRVLTIDGREIRSFDTLQRIVSTSANTALEFVIDRGGETLTKTITPRTQVMEDPIAGRREVGLLGVKRMVSAEEETYEKIGVGTALKEAVYETYFITERTLNYLKRIITGQESASQLGGPIRIGQAAGNAADFGILSLVNLIALLSISVGLLNLMPIPMLDGGHLVFYAIEAVRGKPLGEKTQEWSFRMGFVFVIFLMTFATFNDIVHLITSSVN